MEIGNQQDITLTASIAICSPVSHGESSRKGRSTPCTGSSSRIDDALTNDDQPTVDLRKRSERGVFCQLRGCFLSVERGDGLTHHTLRFSSWF
eukprot:COSAG01_NODE_8366_length_2812_cov_29.171028_1_plen_93_part_00